jgi:hypothetical protein
MTPHSDLIRKKSVPIIGGGGTTSSSTTTTTSVTNVSSSISTSNNNNNNNTNASSSSTTTATTSTREHEPIVCFVAYLLFFIKKKNHSWPFSERFAARAALADRFFRQIPILRYFYLHRKTKTNNRPQCCATLSCRKSSRDFFRYMPIFCVLAENSSWIVHHFG